MVGPDADKKFGPIIGAWIASAVAAGALVAASLRQEPDTLRATPVDTGHLDSMAALDQ